MIKLKSLIKEAYAWERKFGEPLPTLASIQKKKLKEMIKEELNEVRNTRFQQWSDHVRNLDKLLISTLHAKKAIPHKKKELIQIEKHYKELRKLVDIIVGSVVDM